MASEARVLSSIGVSLLEHYVSPVEEAALLERACHPAARWTSVSGRRLQSLGGLVHEKAGLLPAPLPKWLQNLFARLSTANFFASSGGPPNHVLVNAYEPGQGIAAHEDGPLYAPAVAILSLGATAVMCFSPHARLLDAAAREGAPLPGALRVFLPRRSLLVFEGQAYTDFLHGIASVSCDDTRGVCNAPAGEGLVEREGLRVSLTVRRVVKQRAILRL